MKYHELKTPTAKTVRRVGRGIAAGQGKTAGRGTKGQKSRAGSRRRPGFEGGQNPLMQRFPKLRGFHSHHLKPEVVYTGQLNQFTNKVDAPALAKVGLISNPYVPVKIIRKGEIAKKLTVKTAAASQSAVAAIEKAGGSFEVTPRLPRPATSKVAQTPKTGK